MRILILCIVSILVSLSLHMPNTRSAAGDAIEIRTENASAEYDACIENNCDGEPDCDCGTPDIILPADWH
jgi:hypothetical protein